MAVPDDFLSSMVKRPIFNRSYSINEFSYTAKDCNFQHPTCVVALWIMVSSYNLLQFDLPHSSHPDNIVSVPDILDVYQCSHLFAFFFDPAITFQFNIIWSGLSRVLSSSSVSLFQIFNAILCFDLVSRLFDTDSNLKQADIAFECSKLMTPAFWYPCTVAQSSMLISLTHCDLSTKVLSTCFWSCYSTFAERCLVGGAPNLLRIHTNSGLSPSGTVRFMHW